MGFRKAIVSGNLKNVFLKNQSKKFKAKEV